MDLLKCTECNIEFRSIAYCRKHKDVFHSQTFKMFICKPCKYVTLKATDLNRHHKTGEHLNKLTKLNIKDYNKVDTFVYQKQANVDYTTRKSEYLAQLLDSINYDFSYDQNSENSPQLRLPVEPKSSPTITHQSAINSNLFCCGKKFKSKTSHAVHQKQHHANIIKIHVCKACLYASTVLETMSTHQNSDEHLKCLIDKGLDQQAIECNSDNKIIDLVYYENKIGMLSTDISSENLIQLLLNIGYDFSLPNQFDDDDEDGDDLQESTQRQPNATGHHNKSNAQVVGKSCLNLTNDMSFNNNNNNSSQSYESGEQLGQFKVLDVSQVSEEFKELFDFKNHENQENLIKVDNFDVTYSLIQL